MGQERACTLEYDGQTFEGKALLETSELIFRGERTSGGSASTARVATKRSAVRSAPAPSPSASRQTRLKIKFEEISRMDARDGTLWVEFAGGTASFHLGDAAPKWASKILSPPSRLDKLGVKAGTRILWIGAPDAGFRQEAEARGALFVRSKPDLAFLSATAAGHLAELQRLPPGPVWVVYPKGRTELREVEVIDAGRRSGRVDVKVVSYSPAQTGLKFVERLKKE